MRRACHPAPLTQPTRQVIELVLAGVAMAMARPEGPEELPAPHALQPCPPKEVALGFRAFRTRPGGLVLVLPAFANWPGHARRKLRATA